ncbi:cation:proton antiporter domain-containing protein [Lachnospira rogosae (ex Hitch et al. 2025)]|uniref:Cation:proton antiporter n=1 Tax=[Lactobacillus] rogosae TaxID=706562 RepID=A0ABV1BWP8_9FIRM
MLKSIALIMLIGMSTGWVCRKVKLPGLLGMLFTGIILGPYVLNMLDSSILLVSADIRKIALVIILTRAGLTLNLEDLKKVGRPAFLMCFVPATFEMIGMIILAPRLLDVSLIEAAVIGAVVAAVSPAVVVPEMIKIMEDGYGTKQGIPQLILAGASVDDVYVIVMFTAFTSLAQGSNVSVMSLVNIPVSIIFGIIIGIIIGKALAVVWRKVHIRDTVKAAIFLSVALLLVDIEASLNTPITFASLISVMFIGIALKKDRPEVAFRLSQKYNKMWVWAEVMLFVLVGATVDIGYVAYAGVSSIVIIIGALIFRMAGVALCMAGTKLKLKERAFCMLAYTPKATVQAAIGGVPLSMGLACGNTVLTVAVLAIIITAPLGAFAIDMTYRKLLKKS